MRKIIFDPEPYKAKIALQKFNPNCVRSSLLLSYIWPKKAITKN